MCATTCMFNIEHVETKSNDFMLNTFKTYCMRYSIVHYICQFYGLSSRQLETETLMCNVVNDHNCVILNGS